MDKCLIENETGNAIELQTELKKKLLRAPKCAKCRNHGIISSLKGHKKLCCWKECECPSCKMVVKRQRVMASQIAFRRHYKQLWKKSCIQYADELKKRKEIHHKGLKSVEQPTVTGNENFKSFQKRKSGQKNSYFGGKVRLKNTFQPSLFKFCEVQNPCDCSKICTEFNVNGVARFLENHLQEDRSHEQNYLKNLNLDICSKNKNCKNFSDKNNSSAKLSFSIEALLS